MATIRMDWVDDETCDIYVAERGEGEVKVFTMDHGPHGWDGMTGIRDAVCAVAQELNVTIEITGEEGI